MYLHESGCIHAFFPTVHPPLPVRPAVLLLSAFTYPSPSILGSPLPTLPRCPQVQRDCADLLAAHLSSDSLVVRALQYAETLDHVMDFTRLRALGSLFSMLNQLVRNVLNYNQAHPDFPMQARRNYCRNLPLCATQPNGSVGIQ